MNITYEKIDNISDLGIRVYGESIEKIFINVFYAICDLMIKRVKVERYLENTVIQLAANDIEELLNKWLSEVFYFLTVKNVFLSNVCIEKLSCTVMIVKANAQKIDVERTLIKKNIKAVALHDLRITENKKNFCAEVCFDVLRNN
ncbi:MAG: archease [Candidatus Omnitrophica bacterium]|nr:archease [Candidatus Omnitrophota bacterium]